MTQPSRSIVLSVAATRAGLATAVTKTSMNVHQNPATTVPRAKSQAAIRLCQSTQAGVCVQVVGTAHSARLISMNAPVHLASTEATACKRRLANTHVSAHQVLSANIVKLMLTNARRRHVRTVASAQSHGSAQFHRTRIVTVALSRWYRAQTLALRGKISVLTRMCVTA